MLAHPLDAFFEAEAGLACRQTRESLKESIGQTGQPARSVVKLQKVLSPGGCS